MIAIFGATGKVGGAAAFELRRRGLAVRAVVRDPTNAARLVEAGCTIVRADLHDAHAMQDALRDAERALVICPLRGEADDVLADAERTIDAIAAAIESARPGGVVAISDYGAHHAAGTGLALVFRRLEDTLGAIACPITFVRSAEHMQNWARSARVAATRGVLVTLHEPITKLFPTVSAHDVGAVAAALLADPELRSRVVHVEGPRRLSAVDVADVATRLIGRPVIAHAPPRDQWASALGASGLGPDYARLVCELQDAHNLGRIDVEASGEVRHGTTTLETALTPSLPRALVDVP
jgi:NAD(P)H dehydrogenase (quinone)